MKGGVAAVIWRHLLANVCIFSGFLETVHYMYLQNEDFHFFNRNLKSTLYFAQQSFNSYKKHEKRKRNTSAYFEFYRH